MDNTDELIVITDPQAKRWYDFGFLFALNYIYARLPETQAGVELNKEKFKNFVNSRFPLEDGVVVDDGFFEKYSFKAIEPSKYGPGECPGDLPNTCIPCTARGIDPLP